MTDTCTVEVGLLKKHPCGAAAVTKCANCEQSLCARHAVSKMSAGKKVFLCQECARAWQESEKLGDLPAAPSPAPAAASPAAKKPAERPKPAAAATPAPAASSAPLEFTPGKPAAPEKKTELSIEHSAPLEFEPEPKKPEDKK